jgi:DNA-binding response OmpR family regulator
MDSGQIDRFLSREFGARVETADRATEALQKLRESRYHLVLVNRVGDLDGAPGLDLIAALKADDELASVPVMLVSNLPDAQEEAIAAGALPGFGKAELNSSKAVDAVAAALTSSSNRT